LLVKELLSPDGEGAFFDMGKLECWRKFMSTVDKMSQEKNNEIFNDVFDFTLRGK
jgi:hypothetical protein